MTEKKTTHAGLWKKGQSGNPRGRKPGVEYVRKLLEPHRKPLIDKAVALALEGDSTALRLCIERLAPMPRSEYPAVEIPGLSSAQSMADKARCIVNAAGDGLVSPDAASALLAGIAAAVKIVETDELADRILQLEMKDIV